MVADLVRDGLVAWWAPALAFLAGVVSFASPCVFPLVPGYLSFVSGGVGDDDPAGDRRRGALLPILLFIAGFAVVFSLLGALAQRIQPVLARTPWDEVVTGTVIVLFGVAMLLYALRVRWPALYRERRPLLERVRPGPAGAFPLGVAFAVGWSPCIGPVLSGILALAYNEGSSGRAALLMFFYALGLGLPFLLVGLGVHRLLRSLSFVKRNYHWIAGVSGTVMVAIGVLVATGLWVRLLAPLTRFINRFSPPV